MPSALSQLIIKQVAVYLSTKDWYKNRNIEKDSDENWWGAKKIKLE